MIGAEGLQVKVPSRSARARLAAWGSAARRVLCLALLAAIVATLVTRICRVEHGDDSDRQSSYWGVLSVQVPDVPGGVEHTYSEWVRQMRARKQALRLEQLPPLSPKELEANKSLDTKLSIMEAQERQGAQTLVLLCVAALLALVGLTWTRFDKWIGTVAAALAAALAVFAVAAFRSGVDDFVGTITGAAAPTSGRDPEQLTPAALASVTLAWAILGLMAGTLATRWLRHRADPATPAGRPHDAGDQTPVVADRPSWPESHEPMRETQATVAPARRMTAAWGLSGAALALVSQRALRLGLGIAAVLTITSGIWRWKAVDTIRPGSATWGTSGVSIRDGSSSRSLDYGEMAERAESGLLSPQRKAGIVKRQWTAGRTSHILLAAAALLCLLSLCIRKLGPTATSVLAAAASVVALSTISWFGVRTEATVRELNLYEDAAPGGRTPAALLASVLAGAVLVRLAIPRVSDRARRAIREMQDAKSRRLADAVEQAIRDRGLVVSSLPKAGIDAPPTPAAHPVDAADRARGDRQSAVTQHTNSTGVRGWIRSKRVAGVATLLALAGATWILLPTRYDLSNLTVAEAKLAAQDFYGKTASEVFAAFGNPEEEEWQSESLNGLGGVVNGWSIQCRWTCKDRKSLHLSFFLDRSLMSSSDKSRDTRLMTKDEFRSFARPFFVLRDE